MASSLPAVGEGMLVFRLSGSCNNCCSGDGFAAPGGDVTTALGL